MYALRIKARPWSSLCCSNDDVHILVVVVADTNMRVY